MYSKLRTSLCILVMVSMDYSKSRSHILTKPSFEPDTIYSFISAEYAFSNVINYNDVIAEVCPDNFRDSSSPIKSQIIIQLSSEPFFFYLKFYITKLKTEYKVCDYNEYANDVIEAL